MLLQAGKTGAFLVSGIFKALFLKVGILPFLLAACLIVFGVAEERFLSGQNMFNVARQSTYLMIIAMGQMIVLITAGFDLSVGSTIALVSVVSALVMSSIVAADPNAVVLAITAGIAAGILTGALVGVVNGFGVAILNVPPFIMTLGMLSMALGVALILSGGQVIYGIPDAFSEHFGYGRLFGLPAPIFFAFGLFVLVYFLLNYTRIGRYLYAIGSNRRAARLSGISTRTHLVIAYVLCGSLAGVTGLLFTARAATGEATIGATMVLPSVAACAIGGVSLFGGIGRVGNVILGAFFITLITNGMNLTRIESYVQEVVIGAVLVLAVVVDQIRLRLIGQLKVD